MFEAIIERVFGVTVAQDPSSPSQSNNSRLAITHMFLLVHIILADMSLCLPDMWLEGVDIDCIYAGICVLVQFGSTTRRTKNKSHEDVIEWNDEVMLSVILVSLHLAHAYGSKAL